MKSPCSYVSVAVDKFPLKLLDYSLPKALKAQVGCQVEVLLRGRKQRAFVVEVKNETSCKRTLEVLSVLREEVLLSPLLIDLARWMASYYFCPLSAVIRIMIPSAVRKNQQHKEQYYVLRNKSIDELALLTANLRSKHAAQSAILDVMLKVKGKILLTKLLEKARVSRSPVDTLAKQGFLKVEKHISLRDPLQAAEYFKSPSKTLNDEQAVALKAIQKGLDQQAFGVHLLHGITGSGKTEVYLQAIDLAIKKDLGVILLVPEISLTSQTCEHFKRRFDETVAVLHHRLSSGERFDEWEKIRKGDAKIVIGARSAIFSPVQNLGLIIVDEEHEASYKQEDERPCYHAREVAVMLAKLSKSVVLLGSATPSLESFYNASQGKYHLHSLKKRAGGANLPAVRIVDMKSQPKENGLFSQPLLASLKKRLEQGEQSILFLNRRGYHTSKVCKDCGHTLKCQHCDVAMTYHRKENRLSCHLCKYSVFPPPLHCPECKSGTPLSYQGVGTEQIERILRAIFPEARLCRIDRDTTAHKGSLDELISDAKRGKYDILIGTQMLAKGLHFPAVSLVGVINSDGPLNIPDFRASEQIFQLLTQVAGRAGRGDFPGEVIFQTRLPENATILASSKQDYQSFYEEEIAIRELFAYPPFSNIIKLSFTGAKEEETKRAGETYFKALEKKLAKHCLLHPLQPSAYSKVKDQYRFQFLVRSKSVYLVNEALESLSQSLRLASSVKVLVNVSPLSTFF